MGRHYKGTGKQIKGLFVVACACVMLGTGVTEVGARVTYYDNDGYGWKKDGDVWNYIDDDGSKVTDWFLDEDGKRYFMSKSGDMQTGWLEWKNNKYFFDGNGVMITGWLNIDGFSYYFRPGSGEMLVGVNVIGNKSYDFGEDGILVAVTDIEGDVTDTQENVTQESAGETSGTTDTTGNTTESTNTQTPVMELTVVNADLTPLREGVLYYETAGYGWKKDGSVWNYFYKNNIKAVNWVLDTDGTWYFMDKNGALMSGWLDWNGQKFFLNGNGAMQVGWMKTDAGTYYFRQGNGDMLTGTQVIDGQTYEFGADGRLVCTTGWQTIGEDTYFFDSTGKPVTGVVLIDGIQYGFTQEGKLDNSIIPWNLVLVNYQNSIPANFKLSKARVNGYYVDARIAASLKAMIKAAKADGVTLKITSAYRTIARQETLYNNALKKYLNQGLSYENALIQTNLYHAKPGRSEHNLGLAIDFIYGSSLNDSFAYSAAGIWLKEHAYEYGFILRYEEDTTDITKIAYEPWHYRFVGVDAARDIVASDVCFENYFLNYTTTPVTETATPEAVPETTVSQVQENAVATQTEVKQN